MELKSWISREVDYQSERALLEEQLKTKLSNIKKLATTLKQLKMEEKF
jgi:hypothetical protein